MCKGSTAKAQPVTAVYIAKNKVSFNLFLNNIPFLSKIFKKDSNNREIE